MFPEIGRFGSGARAVGASPGPVGGAIQATICDIERGTSFHYFVFFSSHIYRIARVFLICFIFQDSNSRWIARVVSTGCNRVSKESLQREDEIIIW